MNTNQKQTHIWYDVSKLNIFILQDHKIYIHLFHRLFLLQWSRTALRTLTKTNFTGILTLKNTMPWIIHWFSQNVYTQKKEKQDLFTISQVYLPLFLTTCFITWGFDTVFTKWPHSWNKSRKMCVCMCKSFVKLFWRQFSDLWKSCNFTTNGKRCVNKISKFFVFL